ncbi:MAG: fumarylacetoacetate hydrolase family protein [Ectothiorhodospiraceae bacterium]|nr:fumarylacetoacetate hydrolase family protein [Ectothiorhodospiraceae bacterium]
MRWARFEHAGSVRHGLVEGDEVAIVDGDPFDGYRPTGERVALASVRLAVPVEPRTFYAAGLNYAEHVREAAAVLGRAPDLPPKADIGYRATNALIAHDEDVVIPRDATDEVQYEGELVVVIGRRARHLTRENALACVLGYTIGNDVSERSWQREDRTLWRAKNTDTFKPMGPWIETDVALETLRTRVRVNGVERIAFPTNDMIFGVVDFLVAMSRYLTLHPRDVVWMGTEGKSPNLVDGDVVEVEIEPIGTLRNRFVRER